MSKLGAKRPETTVEFCTDLDLQAEHDEASADLRHLQQQDTKTLVSAARTKAAKRVVDLEKQMRDHVILFRLAALPRKKWAELEAEHQPREDNATDAHYGVNMSTFVDAVMSTPGVIVSVVHKKTGETVEFTAADWNAEADEMTNAQWDLFAIAVLGLNRVKAAPGFNRAAWQQTQTSASK